MSKSQTDRASVLFKVSEFADGTPWIATERRGPNLSVLEESDGFLGFDLRSGATLEEAEEIAEYMNKHITTISCTMFTK